MILSSFTVIFTSVFQSNIELWIQFCFLFCGQIQLQVWRKCFSKEKTHCNEKKTSPSVSSFKSLSVTRKLHLQRNIVRDDARPFVNTSKLFLPKHCFICRSRWQKDFFNSFKNSLFFLTVGETFTRGIDSTDEHFTEGSLKKSRWLERTLQRSLFHYLQNFIQYNIRHRFLHTFSQNKVYTVR